MTPVLKTSRKDTACLAPITVTHSMRLAKSVARSLMALMRDTNNLLETLMKLRVTLETRDLESQAATLIREVAAAEQTSEEGKILTLEKALLRRTNHIHSTELPLLDLKATTERMVAHPSQELEESDQESRLMALRPQLGAQLKATAEDSISATKVTRMLIPSEAH